MECVKVNMDTEFNHPFEENNNVLKMDNETSSVAFQLESPEPSTVVHEPTPNGNDQMIQNGSDSSLVEALNIETRPSFSFSRRLSRSSSSTADIIPRSRKTSTDWFVTTTEHIMNKHAYKSQLSQILKSMDQAFTYLQTGQKDIYVQGIGMLIRMNEDVWRTQKIGSELIFGMCDHFRRSGILDQTVQTFIDNKMNVQTQVAELLEAYLSQSNRDYLIQAGYQNEFIKTIIVYASDEKEHRRQIGLGLLETFFAINESLCKIIVKLGGLELLLQTCK